MVVIIFDGNEVNQSFIEKFGTISPWRTRKKFLLYDYVRLIKNIRNNWITEKNQKLLIFYSND